MVENIKPLKWQEGQYTVHRTTAWSGPGCHEGCGVLLYTKNGRVEKIDGDPDHPYNQGRICPRCAAFPEVVYHKDRLKYPLKRVGERGENKWERITWDEAYDTIEKNFRKVIDEYGPVSLLAYGGTGRDLMWQEGRFFYSLGSPNVTTGLSGNSCYMPRAVAGIATVGGFPVADCSQYFEDRYDNPNWKVPEVIAIWGCNPVYSNPDWFFGAWIVECMKRGSKLIVIDPRMTWLAARADIWLPIRPGTDSALAMAMLNVIIEEELYDKEFVDKWCSGFDLLTEQLKKYPVDKMAETTWIPKEKIAAAARMYAKAKPATCQLGVAVDMQRTGIYAAQAIMQIACITGNIDVPGGTIITFPPFGIWQTAFGGWGLEEFVTPENRAKAIGHSKYPLMKYGIPLCSPDEAIKQLETGDPYPIKALWIQGTNPIACHAQDPKRWYNALKKIDFIAAAELFMTPTTMALCDIVLPVTTWAEKDAIRAQFYNVSTINRVIDNYEDCKTDAEIIREIGRRFNPEAWPETTDDIYELMAEPSGMTFKELLEKHIIYPPFEYYKHEKGLLRQDGQPGFATKSGKIELSASFFEQFDLPTMPYYEEPFYSPVSTPELYEKYPLIMMTGARNKVAFHSEHRQINVLREIVPDPFVEIHPDYAKEHGIVDGEWVWVENQKDRIRQRAKVTAAIHPKMALTYHAWWYPEKEGAEPNLYGVWEVNNNRLLEMGNVGVSGFGADVKCCLCKVYKMKEGEM